MRILIVDDHEVVRRGVRSLLSTYPDLEVCGEAVDGQDAIEQSQKLKPDLILMDISMPRLNGLEATREIRRILPLTNILILTQHSSPEMMQQALNAGARGYVLKSEISENLIAGIEKVYCGQLFLGAAVPGKTNNLDSQEIFQRSETFEKALHESEERFRLTFEQAAVGMAHVAEDGHWLLVNQKICEISGYTESELLQMRFQDITHPDDLAADVEQARKVIKGELDQYSMEKRYIRKDRSLVWINLTVSAVRDSSRQLKYFVVVIEDISERREAEERLNVVLDYQTATMDNMVEGLYTLNAKGLVTSVNPAAAAMFGWTAEELLGKKMHDVTHYKHPDGSPFPASECPGLHVLEHGVQLREQEDVFIRKDGSLMPVVYSSSPLLRNGRITGVVMGFRDDTEQRRVRTELREQIQRQHVFSQLADQLHRSTSEEEVYHAAVDAIPAALGCDRASVLVREENGVLQIAAWRGLSEAYRRAAEDFLVWSGDQNDPRPVYINDVATGDLSDSLKAVLREEGIGALASIPLLSNGKLLGELVAYFNGPHRLSEAEIELGQTIARQIAFAIDRQRSAEATRRSEERFQALAADLDFKVRARTAELERRSADLLEQSEHIRDLSGLLLQAQDLERRRIARELHDSAGQILAGLGLNLSLISMKGPVKDQEVARALEDSRRLVKELSDEIRTMSYLLHPPVLDEWGLAEALRWYVQGLIGRSALDITLEIPPGFNRLQEATELAIFRVVQEALTNIHRHSGSNVATIRLRQHDGHVTVEIEDRGRGIPAKRLADIQSDRSGLGIRGMRERIRQAHGEMKISSNRKGTVISARFPASEIPIPVEPKTAPVF
jgi:PAS domain S-box-containing protein